MESTTIRITKKTHEKLTKLCKKEQSYDDLINQLIKKKEDKK